MKKYAAYTAMLGFLLSAGANAATINVDLSGAVTSTLINGDGADFAGTFVGQTIDSGTGITGSPTGPLTLAPSNNLVVTPFFPVVSPAGNSIEPAPGAQGPLSVLLDELASSITFTMGSADTPPPVSTVDIIFFDFNGNVIDSLTQDLVAGYGVYNYTFSGFDVGGMTIYNNNDTAGLRYMNFSYTVVPIPAAAWLFVSGFLGLVGLARRNKIA